MVMLFHAVAVSRLPYVLKLPCTLWVAGCRTCCPWQCIKRLLGAGSECAVALPVVYFGGAGML